MRMKKLPGRINKSDARKKWDNNEQFIVVPCKCRPYDLFGNIDEFAYLVIPEIEKKSHASFAHFLDSFSYYNCNSICGMYPAFYVVNK